MADRRSDLAGRAAAEAKAAGVTRLADVTGLDVLGIPVWQAIRPWSRALSVHQGKGLTAEAAKIGALVEAVESARAEAFDAPATICSFARLPAAERAPAIEDFANRRDCAPDEDEPIAWAPAGRLAGGGPLWVPFDCVSLDLAREGDRRLDRSSNGLGAREEADGALFKALLELLERDAHAAWEVRPIEARTADLLDLDTVPLGWFQDLRERARSAGLRLAVYRQSSVIGAPVFLAQILDLPASDPKRRAVHGHGCHLRADAALRDAVLEAAQSRLTLISGARDDILYEPQQRRPGGLGFGLPPPPGMRLRRWEEIGSIELSGVADLAHRLADAGFPDAAAIDLSRPGAGVFVFKAFVPGLGAFERTRRT
ncbi:MAG TPA: YcaO-like family protein [Caulobacteraceae bacterium]|nr:YcaO-like family protein [Caulobacteraceae bacterium]